MVKLLSQNVCNDVSQAIRVYGHGVQSLAFVYMKSKFDAEDIAQEVFIRYMRKAPRFPTAQKEKAWLMTVTANLCKSTLRAKYRDTFPLTDDLSYLPREESAVLLAVMALEEKYRLPIHLHYYEGYSLEEIAKLMRVRPGTVGSWLSRGREKLKQILEEEYSDG